MRFAVAAAVALMASPAMAQNYCANGSAAAELAGNPTAGMQALREKCRPGDTVFMHPSHTALIGQACDFSKSVIAAGPRVICVLRR